MEAVNAMVTPVAARPAVAARAAQAKPVAAARVALSGRPARYNKTALRQGAKLTQRRNITVAAAEAEAREEAVAEEAPPAPVPAPADNKKDLSSFSVGQVVKGKVAGIAAYGAFVDIGATKDGLVHISKMASGFVEDVKSIVTAGQEVEVRIIEVDAIAGKLSLSMVLEEPAPRQRSEGGRGQGGGRGGGQGGGRGGGRGRGGRSEKKINIDDLPFNVGDTITGTVTRTVAFGAFVEVAEGVEGLLHSSQLMIPEGMAADARVDSILEVGKKLEVTVLEVGNGKISLTNKTSEFLEEESRLKAGVGAGPKGKVTGSLAEALLAAGVSASNFSGAGAAEVSTA
eukprot:CAMPEP_0117687424 /NCGR_PEP_ID=MMETSP0804-20121206/23128_1 /TAXON_ID=1074897 /ORGANISM="Tetraselmis astigmatica, Strain CCMP880" /LENGTH=341 /DNA_ID=CAMNT_0005499487 /DNA_START=80 /DNA_END=1105 /DNA_ORIENTATION=-